MKIVDDIRDRVNRFREVKSGLNIQYDVDAALEAIHISQENIDDIKLMASTNGWKLMVVLMDDEIAKLRNNIFRMSSNPTDHKNEMQVAYATVRVMERIKKIVEDTLKTEPFVRMEHDALTTINDGTEYE